ncbi:MAG: Ig-like domain-containing protein [Patescibacteria group bacterium]
MKISKLSSLFIFFILYGLTTSVAAAASLSLAPGSGSYAPGATFTVRLSVNSQGQSINAADGTLKFDPSQLSVVSATRAGSIFNLWVTEPTFSNTAGTVTFSGGLPSGYTGSGGNIMSVTFKAKGSGTTKVSVSNGSVLANDGQGTNVLSSMGSASFSIQAAAPAPTPTPSDSEAEEEVAEYTPPANTPAAPKVTSSTHKDPNAWSNVKTASLEWEIPTGITAVRTLLDDHSSSIPTKIYDSPIHNIDLTLDEGVSYFHIQFKNADGWGKVTHYRLAIDSEKPTGISISQSKDTDLNAPEQKFVVDVDDAASDVLKFKIQLDSNEPFEYKKENKESSIPVANLTPGYHTVIMEGFDEAGNSIIGTYSFTIETFAAPVFTEVPTEISEQIIPVIKGTTRPNATVDITLTEKGAEGKTYQVKSDESGAFTFIPDSKFKTGIYELTARAIDQYGAQSASTEPIKIAVQQPGLIRIGFLLISAFSIIIPLILLVGLAIAATWYLVLYLRRLRRKIKIESVEALEIMRREFTALDAELVKQESTLIASRKTKKLTGAEQTMIVTIRNSLLTSQKRVEKELLDVAALANQSD